MPRTRKVRTNGELLLTTPPGLDDPRQSSLLDVVDSVLNKGAVVNGDLILGVANVDLIYARLSVLLSALDKVVERTAPRSASTTTKKKSRRAR